MTYFNSKSHLIVKSSALVLASALLVACGAESDNSNACNSEPGVYDIGRASALTLVVSNQESKLEEIDNKTYLYHRVEAEYLNEEVAYDELSFGVKFDVDVYTADNTFAFPLPFIAVANACSGNTAYEYAEKITSINVTASAAYSGELPAGASLNDVVEWQGAYYIETTDFGFHQEGTQLQSLSETFADNSEAASDVVVLGLSQPPEQSGTYIFFIEVTLDNGEVYQVETPEVSIKGSAAI